MFVGIFLLALSLWHGQAIALPKSVGIQSNSSEGLSFDQGQGQLKLASSPLQQKLYNVITNNGNSGNSPLDQLGIDRARDDCDRWIQSYDPPYISSGTISEICAAREEGSTLKNDILQCLQARFGNIEMINDAIERDCSYSQRILPPR